MEDYKKLIRQTFDTVSKGYDNNNLRFFKTSSVSMLDFAELKGAESLIDVAAGTGNVAIEAAQRLKKGKVHATDLSEKMLEIIKEKSLKNSINNITFELNDLESLSHHASFDVATCAFGIFFIADMLNGLKIIKNNLKKGGKILLTTFNENFLYPLSSLFYERLESNGIPKNPTPWELINTPDKTINFMQQAGFKDIEIKREQHGYFLKDANAWWDVIWNAGMRRAVQMLPDDKKEDFIKNHLEEIQQLSTKKGIWMEVEVIFAKGVS